MITIIVYFKFNILNELEWQNSYPGFISEDVTGNIIYTETYADRILIKTVNNNKEVIEQRSTYRMNAYASITNITRQKDNSLLIVSNILIVQGPTYIPYMTIINDKNEELIYGIILDCVDTTDYTIYHLLFDNEKLFKVTINK